MKKHWCQKGASSFSLVYTTQSFIRISSFSRNKHTVVVDINLLVGWMTAHWTGMVRGDSQVGFSVVFLKVMQAISMVHVGTVEEGCLFVVDEGIEADGAIRLSPLHRLRFDTFPEVAQLLCHLLLLVHCK